MMNQEVYRKLAQKLAAIPNGFPQTESGIELKVLAKIYTRAHSSERSQEKGTIVS